MPSDPAWPRVCHGVRLGIIVYNIRNQGAYHAQLDASRAELQQAGWINLVGSAEDKWNRIILPAHHAFHAVHGHTDVPARFTVPTNEP